MKVERLPRGRHGLSREQVERSQRQRILWALAQTMSENGYAATSVAHVLRAAGVSRETFYEQFSSKADCFASAFEAAVDIVVARMAAGLARGNGGGSDPVAPLERALAAYLDALAAEPAYARLFLIEVYAAGPEALERRARAQLRFVDLVTGALGVRSAEDRFAVEAFVAATSSLVTARLAAGDPEGLRDLRAPLTRLARRLLSLA